MKHCAKRLLIVLMLVLAFLPGHRALSVESWDGSADYLIHSWGSEDGLPHNAVLTLAQTPDGYIWVGTRSGGLARFDGERFVSFNPQNTPELRDVEMETMSVDEHGVLWIATGNEAMSSYKDGRFILHREQRANPRWHPEHMLGSLGDSVIWRGRGNVFYRLPRSGATNVAEIFQPAQGVWANRRIFRQDQSGRLWFITEKRQLAYFENGVEKQPQIDEGLLQGRQIFFDIATDERGNLVAATASQILRWTGNAFELIASTNGPAPQDIRRLVPCGDGSLWVCEPTRDRRLKDGSWIAQSSSPINLPMDPTVGPFGDSKGGFWRLDYGVGVRHVHPDGHMDALTPTSGFPSQNVTSWLEDDEGNIWIGTIDSGLVRIRPRLFRVYGVNEGLPDDAMQSVCEDAAGVIWAGTVSGQLARMASNRFETIELNIPARGVADSVTVYPESGGDLWMGIQRIGVFRLHREIETGGYNLTMASPGQVRLIMEDSQQRVWIGHGGGLRYWKDGKVTPVQDLKGFGRGFGIGGLTEGSEGTIWVGSGPGELWRLENEVFDRFTPPATWAQARFSAMLADDEGAVWIGSLGGGLVRFKNGGFTRITSASGLPNDFITQLLEDEEGYLWAGTYAGIFRASKSDLNSVVEGKSRQVACLKFGRFDGLPALECSGGFFHPAAWHARDGKLWFATLKGIVSVDPTKAKAFRRPPPVRIEEFRVNGQPRSFFGSSRSGLGKALAIEPGRHALQFRYTAFNYTAPDDLSFRYRLVGADNKWQDNGKQRVVSFAPLDPGNYEFQVAAANSSGLWSEANALSFRVQPFLWETWWFKFVVIAALFLLLLTLVGMSIRRRYRQRIEKLRLQQEVERERTRIAQDLHDDLGTNLTQISLLSALASRQMTPKTEVEEITREIRSKARQMVTGLNEIVWAVNPSNDSLNDMLGYLGSFAGDFLAPTSIRCRLDFPETIADRKLSAEVRHNIYLAFKEALNNAAKYAEANELTVIAREEHGRVSLAVRDDGKGMILPSDNRWTGNGLRNMRSRLAKIGGSCEIESAPDQGTTVTFYLPR